MENKNILPPRDENGYSHGYCEYYEDDKLLFKGCLIHGKRYGYWERYSSDGLLWYKGYFYMGERLYQTPKNKFIL